jgi:hypothetical protein
MNIVWIDGWIMGWIGTDRRLERVIDKGIYGGGRNGGIEEEIEGFDCPVLAVLLSCLVLAVLSVLP